jgi:hypothetical protein
MTLAIIILLALWVLRLGVLLERQRQMNLLLVAQNKSLSAINTALRLRVEEPDGVVSDLADGETATAFAILCGYMAAIQSHHMTEDVGRRADALPLALAYYRERVAARVASANH